MAKNMPKGVVDFRGKAYKTVALRVHEFREVWPISDGWAIRTRIVEAGDPVVVCAEVVDPEGRVVGVGHAEETRSTRGVNSTSALENCETSAVGRALAACGLAGEEYCSADELAGAITQQKRVWSDDEQRAFIGGLDSLELDLMAVENLCISLRRPVPSKMNDEQRMKLLDYLETDAGKAAIKGGRND